MTDLAEIWVTEPQNNSKNNGTNFTRGHIGQISAIRCFVQNFYMVAYVTKAGLGPEFVLLCRSFFRWSILVLQRHAYLLCLYCLLFRWSRGGVGIVVLADSRRQVLPGQPVPSLFKLRQGVWRCKNLNGCLWDLFYYIFRYTHRYDDWVKKSTNRPRIKKVGNLDKPCNLVTWPNWRLSGKWVKSDPIGHNSLKNNNNEEIDAECYSTYPLTFL